MTVPASVLPTILIGLFLSATFMIRLPAQSPRPAGISLPIDQLEPFVLPRQDNQHLQEQEKKRKQAGQNPRFAVAIPVQITPDIQGRWDQVGGLSVWRMRLQSPGAYSLNLGFSQYQMPEGGALYLYAPRQEKRLGPFTPADNESHNELWTPIFPGDELVIEIQVPTHEKSKLAIHLAFVNHDFLGFGQLNSGSCNLDAVCGIADGWETVEPFRDVARSVGLYSIQGRFLCTGFLVNNTQEDCTPYFLTANHCKVNPDNAASVVVYWNYENSSCRQPGSIESGQSGDGQLNDFNTGSIFRAGWANSDFSLIELDDPVSNTANAFFAGWSAIDEIPQGTVASIHHPFTDEKRISLSDNTVHFGFAGSGQEAPDGDQIIVTSWTTGSTEMGSSGGPLFNREGQALGQLFGGIAACGNDGYDSFGRIHNSWEGGGTTDSRLKDWLDPIGTGLLSLEGREQNRCDLLVLGAFNSGTICAGSSDTLRLSFGPGFETLPALAIGPIDQSLHITTEDVSTDNPDIRSFVWHTSENTPAGQYSFEVYATYDGVTDTSFYLLTIIGQSPDTPVLLTPPDLSEDQALKLAFTWSSQELAGQYRLQIALDPDFTMLFSDQWINEEEAPEVVVSDLPANTRYYWRVAAGNICGISEWSLPYTFTTADFQCDQFAANDGPVEIPSVSTSTVSSSLALDISGSVASIEVANLNIKHRWVGDLSIILQSPSGKEVALLDRPGFPSSLFGCDGSDLLLNFNQDFGDSHQSLEGICGTIPPSISGTFKPLESLQTLLGEVAAGTWTLIIKDQAADDGGALIGWELNICTLPEEISLVSGLSNAYTACVDDSLQIELVISETFEGEEVVLSLDPAATGGSITFSKNPVAPGDTVTLLLSDLVLAGNFSLELKAVDGSNTNLFPFELAISKAPEPVILETPATASTLSEASTTFTWTASNTPAYRFEIAEDPDFVNIIHTAEVTTPFYTLEMQEQEGAFYWRVLASNSCGTSSSEVFSFIFSTSGVSWLEDGQQARVYPNPFKGLVQLEFDRPLEVTVPIRVLDLNGRILYTDSVDRGNRRKTLSLDHLPSGFYLLELRYKGQRYVERLIRGR